MAFPTSTALVSGQTAGLSTTFNALRSDLAAINAPVIKTADESVTSSTTLQNDDHLLYSIPATGSYVFDLYLYGTSAANAAGDINLAMAFSSGTCHFGIHALDAALASGNSGTMNSGTLLSATSGASFVTAGLSTSTTTIWLHGILIGANAGTLRLMWSQNASNANASTLKAGSHMLVRQVA